jgi:predicted nucleotide-binding protein
MKKDEAVEKLKRQQSLVEELKGENNESPKFHKWQRDTEVALRKIFGDRHDGRLRFINIPYYRAPSFVEMRRGVSHTDQYGKGMEEAKSLLQSLIEEIEEYGEDEPNEQVEGGKKVEVSGTDVFIVHGRDETAKETVARFIEKLGLNAIILHEKPNAGRTLIEKFETFSNVGFAIVLMTPDDVGALSSEKDKLKHRARQNVIFELGFFIGKLGRSQVCALYAEGVEIPSDYEGVVFIKMKDNWKISLAKEIKAAGINVDMNKAV